MEKINSCVWLRQEDPDGDEFMETQCGKAFEFIEGDMQDNDYKFCPYCGKKIKEE